MKTAQNLKFSKPEGWSWADGIGFLPFGQNKVEYDAAYFQKYVNYAHTPLGYRLTRARLTLLYKAVGFVALRHCNFLDIGIGSGDYVQALRRQDVMCYGQDVNPVAIDWLKQRGWLMPELELHIEAVSLWDVLEHIENPKFDVFDHYRPKVVLISMPIYRDEAHVFQSKHYRPGEHCWYFTSDGLKLFMYRLGYICMHETDIEVQLGREDIGSFIFKKRQ